MRSLGWSLLCPFLLAATPAISQSAAIPRHPSELVFPVAAWRPPSGAEAGVDLPSGARVYFVADHSLPLFDLVVAARIGSHLDPAGKPGLASLTTELLARGGTADLSPDDFDATVERLGGRVLARVSPTNSALGIDGPGWAAGELIDLFVGLLAEPGFDGGRLRSLEGNLREGMRRRNDDPLTVLEREWERLLYGTGHFSTRPLVPADLDRLERTDLVAFHRQVWRPENLVLAVSGDLDRRELLARLNERLAAWPEAVVAPLSWPPPPPGPGIAGGPFLLASDLAQAKVLAGHRLPPVAEEDRAALALLAEVLGGRGAVSRIQGRLRTAEGLVYRSSTVLEPGELWPGELRIFFETRPAGVVRAVELVRAELEGVREQPVGLRELDVARAALLATLRTDFDAPEEIAGRLAENALLGRPEDHWPRWREAVATVDAETVRDAARRYLRPDGLVVLVLGTVDATGRERLATLLRAPLRILPERDAATQEPLETPAPGQQPESPPPD
jgi:zinc protease